MQSELPFINGARTPVASGQAKELIDPATGQPLIKVAQAGLEEVELGIRSAESAFRQGDWARMSSSDR